MKYFFLLLVLPLTSFAGAIKHPELNFTISPAAMIKGETHYSFRMLTPEKLRAKLPLFKGMDSIALTKAPDSMILISKTISLLNRPAGFFDNGIINDLKFLKHLMGEQTITKLSENLYEVEVPGVGRHHYKMMIHFDSDDISSLPRYPVIHAVTNFRKLDVISLSASSIMMKEMTEYSNYLNGAVSISGFIPLKENKTLMISYHLMSVRKKFADKKALEKSFINEVLAQEDLIDSFDAK